MEPIGGVLCSICGEPLPIPFGQIDPAATLCGLCRRLQPPYVKATAYGSYQSGLRELIHLLKYERVRPAASVLGRMLAEAIADLRDVFQDAEILVVPVPLHSRKHHQRGYNQAELIARAAVKQMAVGSFEMGDGILERRRETQSQIGLSSHQRRENIRGVFAVTQSEASAGREILLVDDVFTTGTTVSECARVLRRAGASKVYVATVARTLKYEAQQAELKPAMPATFTMAAAG
jgi:ComF family protein